MKTAEKLDQPMIRDLFKEMDIEYFKTLDFIVIDPKFKQFDDLMAFYAQGDKAKQDTPGDVSDIEEIIEELMNTGVSLSYNTKKFNGGIEVKSVRLYGKTLHFISLKKWI
jgi:hypothetical protein